MVSSKAESALKRNLEETIIAYAHDVSEQKKNRNNTMDYMTMTLQTSPTKACTALLYLPQKRKVFLQSQETKTEIKIKDFTRTKGNKIIINDVTFVNKPSTLSFHFSST